LKVVFVPGFMQRGEAWRAVADLLPERIEAVLLDHRAHDYEGRLAEIAAAGEGAAVAGYSLGGRLVLHAALRDPGRYTALITVGTSAGIEDAAERAGRASADQSDVLVDQQRAGRLDHDPLDLASLLRTAGQGALAPVWNELPRLSLPVLALAGERDERYTAAARRIAESVRSGRAATVEHAGHAPQLQRPDAVASLIVDFLDEHLG
jgi:2-succinyl-6-hydroxy-2,4-cyclohexadiene-1-carboxylate synthase